MHVICLEKEGEMRAPEEDLAQAREEGVIIHNSCTMSAIRVKEGRATGVDYYEVAACRFDEAGRLSLDPVPGGEHAQECDTVIFAVGMKTDLEFMGTDKPALTPRNWIVTDERQASSLAGRIRRRGCFLRPRPPLPEPWETAAARPSAFMPC